MKGLLIFVGIIFLFAGYAAAECSYTGTWSTEWGPMTLSQVGNSVTGTYEYDSGRINGTVSGGVFKGKWSEAPTYTEPDDAGDEEFTISSDCNKFTGRWGYGSSGNMSGEWIGTRIISASNTQDNTLLYVIGVVILLVMVVALFAVKKKKK